MSLISFTNRKTFVYSSGLRSVHTVKTTLDNQGRLVPFGPHGLYPLKELDPLVCGVAGNVQFGEVFQKRAGPRLGVEFLQSRQVSPHVVFVGFVVLPEIEDAVLQP
jgi:hypothetical protein